MDTVEIIVVVVGVLLVGFVVWFFFMSEGEREGREGRTRRSSRRGGMA